MIGNCVSQRVNPTLTAALAFGIVGAESEETVLVTITPNPGLNPAVDLAVAGPTNALAAPLTMRARIVTSNQVEVTVTNASAIEAINAGDVGMIIHILKGTGQALVGSPIPPAPEFADFVIATDMDTGLFQFPENPATTNVLALRLREWDGVVYTDRDFEWSQDNPSGAGVFGFTLATTPEEMADIMAAQIALDTGFVVTHVLGTPTFRITQPVAGGDSDLSKMLWFSVLHGPIVLGPVTPSGFAVNGNFAPLSADIDGSAASGSFVITSAGFNGADFENLSLGLEFNTATGSTPLELRSVHTQAAPLPPDTATDAYVETPATAADYSAALAAAWDSLGFNVIVNGALDFTIEQVNDGPAGLAFLQMSGAYTDATRIVFQTVALPAGTGINRSERCLAIGVGVNLMDTV